MRKQERYTLDSRFCLHYGNNYSRTLYPCQKIQDAEVCLGVIGNGKLNPQSLSILPKDRHPIVVSVVENNSVVTVSYPGKSAIINFETECTKEVAWGIVREQLSGNPDRRDHLHVATVGAISNVAWVVFWAPLQLDRKILHARMVADRTLRYGEDPTEKDRETLVQVFQKIV